jgi:Holliday junction DNA helicase RuvA
LIGYLRGVLQQVEPDSSLVDVGGVGYLVRTSLTTYYELDTIGKGGEVELLIHTHVRDDTFDLFGFRSAQEKALFERLISVSGIGPKLAQVILSGMPPQDLLAGLAAGDAVRLTRIPGVGKKTAERMVLELRDKAQVMLRQEGTEPEVVRPGSALEDVVQALINLGYRQKEAEQAVSATDQDNPGCDFQELLRKSLKSLSRA